MQRPPVTGTTVATQAPWNGKQHKLHAKLSKVESTIATLLRTEHVGLNGYLKRMRVPGHPTAACPCGYRTQSTNHVVIHCPLHEEGRRQMYLRAGTATYAELLSTPKGVKAVAEWFLGTNLLPYLALAREMAKERSPQTEDTGFAQPLQQPP